MQFITQFNYCILGINQENKENGDINMQFIPLFDSCISGKNHQNKENGNKKKGKKPVYSTVWLLYFGNKSTAQKNR